MQKFTIEQISNNQVEIRQPAKGYRFSMDPILLSEHTINYINGTNRDRKSPSFPCLQKQPSQSHHPKNRRESELPPFRILDIGTGSAVMPLLLARHLPFSNVRITGVEIQKDLVHFARHNIDSNQMESHISLIHGDIRKMGSTETNGAFDVVISNPPYQKKASSRLNADSQKAIARHEITLCLEELIQSTARLLKPNGTVLLIYPASRLTELLLTLRHYNMEPEAVRFIHTKKDINAKLLLISAIKNAYCSMMVHPPLYIEEWQPNCELFGILKTRQESTH